MKKADVKLTLPLKKEYNEKLIRHCSAWIYLENPDIPLEEKEQHIPAYKAIVERLDQIIEILKDKGVQCGEDEICGGFHI